jgi:hypothetical protein
VGDLFEQHPLSNKRNISTLIQGSTHYSKETSESHFLSLKE